MNFALKIIKNGKIVQSTRTRSIRRFIKNLRTINWQDGHLEVYLRVSYGKHKDNYGKISTFYNNGRYETKEDLWLAFNAFRERGINNAIKC